MKKFIVAAALVAGATFVAGCDTGTSVNTKADSKGSSSHKTKDSGGKSDSSGPAKIGDPVTISGQLAGEKIQVTAVKYLPLVLPTNEFTGPTKGHRWVAVQFQINNVGTKPYDDSPTNGTKAIDAKGQQYDAAFTDGIKAGPELPSSMKVVPGGKALGYITYEVPAKTKVAQIQFSMDSGFGDTAQWDVK